MDSVLAEHRPAESEPALWTQCVVPRRGDSAFPRLRARSNCWLTGVVENRDPTEATGLTLVNRAARVLDGLILAGTAFSDTKGPEPEASVGTADKSDSDERLIRACLAGDENSYARLVERYERPVAALLWHFTRDRLVLEELIQDTFVEAYLSLSRFRRNAPFFPWLRTITTRVGYRYWRRRRQRLNREAILAEWQREARLVARSHVPSDTAEHVYRLLELLDPKDRLVLTLQYFEGCNTREIAERIGWTGTLVKVRAFRARKKLKTLLLNSEQFTEGGQP